MQFTASYHPASHSSHAVWAVSVVSQGAEAAAYARQANRLTDRLQDRLANRDTRIRVTVHGDEAVEIAESGQSLSRHRGAGNE